MRHRRAPERGRSRTDGRPSDRVRRGTRRLVLLPALLVWCLLVASVVPGVAAGGVPAERTALADLEAVRGDSVNATATLGRIAAGVGDRVEVSGATTVDAGAVRLYLVGPRGRFLDSDGNDAAMETETVRAGTFDASYASFTRRGAYRLLVVSPRADGTFEATETLDRDALPSGVTQRQAVDLVRAAYGRDEVVDLTLYGETPRLSVDVLSPDGTVGQGDTVTVTGTTNRGDGTTVFVDLVAGDGRVVTSVEGSVDAATGTWEGDLDLSGVETGTYTVFVDDTASTASTPAIVRAEATTPAETPVPDESVLATDADEAEDARETVDTVANASVENATEGGADANETVGAVANGRSNDTNATANGTNGSASATNGTADGAGSTGGAVPGFGLLAFLAALTVVALAGRRRGRD